MDVLAGLGAGRQRNDCATCVVLGEHTTDDRTAAVAYAGEDDLRSVIVRGHGWRLRVSGLEVAVAEPRCAGRATNQPDCQKGADELGSDEARHRAGRDPGEGVGEHAGDGDRGVGEAGRRGEPVRGSDVAADGEGDRVGRVRRAALPKIDQQQAEGGHDLAEPESPAPVAVVGRDGDGVEVEHQVGDDRPEQRRPQSARATRAAAVGGRDRRPSDLGQGHDWVERGRDRLERQDERDQNGAGGEAVLEQLQPDVVGGEALPRRSRSRSRRRPGTPCRRNSAVARRASVAVTPATPPMSAAEVGERVGVDAGSRPRRRACRGRAGRPRAAP